MPRPRGTWISSHGSWTLVPTGKQAGGDAMAERCWARLHVVGVRRWYALCSPRGRRMM
ncbi:unnamed protein product [Ectocarpus fasciculatus]